jgi:hypothetical protein
MPADPWDVNYRGSLARTAGLPRSYLLKALCAVALGLWTCELPEESCQQLGWHRLLVCHDGPVGEISPNHFS